MKSRREWIEEYIEAAEVLRQQDEEYIKKCEELGLELYVCNTEGCDRRIPCRRHKSESGDESKDA